MGDWIGGASFVLVFCGFFGFMAGLTISPRWKKHTLRSAFGEKAVEPTAMLLTEDTGILITKSQDQVLLSRWQGGEPCVVVLPTSQILGCALTVNERVVTRYERDLDPWATLVGGVFRGVPGALILGYVKGKTREVSKRQETGRCKIEFKLRGEEGTLKVGLEASNDEARPFVTAVHKAIGAQRTEESNSGGIT